MKLYKHAKLSTIWSRADKELVQVRNQFGNIHKKQACAMGAICYYLSDRKLVTPFMLNATDSQWYEQVLKRFERKTGKSALAWNDLEEKSFKELAAIAKKVSE